MQFQQNWCPHCVPVGVRHFITIVLWPIRTWLKNRLKQKGVKLLMNLQVMWEQPWFFSIGHRQPGHGFVVTWTVCKDNISSSRLCFMASLFCAISNSSLILLASACCSALALLSSSSWTCLCLSCSTCLSLWSISLAIASSSSSCRLLTTLATSSSRSIALRKPSGSWSISSYSSQVRRSCHGTECLKQDRNPQFRQRIMGCNSPLAWSWPKSQFWHHTKLESAPTALRKERVSYLWFID